MRLTESKLRRVIREETRKLLNENKRVKPYIGFLSGYRYHLKEFEAFISGNEKWDAENVAVALTSLAIKAQAWWRRTGLSWLGFSSEDLKNCARVAGKAPTAERDCNNYKNILNQLRKYDKTVKSLDHGGGRRLRRDGPKLTKMIDMFLPVGDISASAIKELPLVQKYPIFGD